MPLQRWKIGSPDERTCALGRRAYSLALVLLVVVSDVFSASIQSTLPRFSHLCRLVFTGAAVLLLLAKCLLLTRYDRRWQLPLVLTVLAVTGADALYVRDHWFFLAVLAGLAASGVDLRRVLRLYLLTAAASLLLVQLLHAVTPLIPYKFYCRNWDYGYGHYNGYAARWLGVFFAWAWLRWPRLRWWDWLGLALLPVYILLVPGARGAAGAMLLLLALLALQRLWPAGFESRLWRALVLALCPLLTAASLLLGYFYRPLEPQRYGLLARLNALLSGRLEIWSHVFWHRPALHVPDGGGEAVLHDGAGFARLRLLGGLVTDGDAQHAIDNSYLALLMNKGILGAVLITAAVLMLVWRLARRRCTGELLLIAVMLLYLLMENNPFLISADPLFLLLPCLLAPRGAPLPTLCPRPDPPA